MVSPPPFGSLAVPQVGHAEGLTGALTRVSFRLSGAAIASLAMTALGSVVDCSFISACSMTFSPFGDKSDFWRPHRLPEKTIQRLSFAARCSQPPQGLMPAA